MSISKRIVRLVKSDIHEILDCLEDPQAILSQAIRDMEDEMRITQARSESLQSESQKIGTFIARLESSHAEAVAQIETCFDSENETLVRTFIRKRLELEKRRKQLLETQAGIQKELSECQTRLKEQEEKITSIKEKQDLFTNYEKQSSASPAYEEKWAVSEEQVELAILEERRKRGATGRAI